MGLNIKNKQLVVSNKKGSKATELVIKRRANLKAKSDTKLSEVLSLLPPGLIQKEETGMGATTLELISMRNSIIVEPIRITSSSKAFKHSALYVGSPTKLHPQKKSLEKNIKDYVSNPSIQYKKIIVVADSLPKVIKAIGDTVFQDYFLLLDEIDSFQLDSTFRTSMEKCLDIYKQFPGFNRAMISATIIEFSDPILKNEQRTNIVYDIKSRRDISVFTTTKGELHSVTVDILERLIKKHPTDKIFIAYNSVNGCLELATFLTKNNIVKVQDVNILCSSASAKSVDLYFKELDSDKLPAKINFFTSAYFTGFDINEKYHLVSVSGTRRNMLAISDSKFKQIAGRSRLGLISETIIHDYKPISDTDEINPTLKSLLEAAQMQISTLECASKNLKNSVVMNYVLTKFVSGVLELFVKQNRNYVREIGNNQFEISYLNIDAKLESDRVRTELYLDEMSLTNKLSLEHNVTQQIVGSNTYIQKHNTVVVDRNNQVDEILGKLTNVTSKEELNMMIKTMKFTPLQKKILKNYLGLIGYVNHEKMLELIKSAVYDTSQDTKLNRLFIAGHLSILPDTHPAIRSLNVHFPLKAKLTRSNIKHRLDAFFVEMKYDYKIKDDHAAASKLNLLRRTYRTRKGKTDFIVITGLIPINIPVTKKLPHANAEDLFSTIFINY